MSKRKRTLLVLGAGASMAYGFPSGVELRGQLCSPLPGENALQLFNSVGHTKDDVQNFSKVFFKTQLISIDRFLYLQQQFSEVGKLAIAQIISVAEQRNELYDAKPGFGHWYRYLWNIISQQPGQLERNWLRVITFNYDRSLEHFLARSYAATWDLHYEQAVVDVLSAIPIRHIYGSIGGLPGRQADNATAIPYGIHLTPETARLARNSIRTIHERDHDKECFEQIEADMKWADRVAFLGFGYDVANMQRLALGNLGIAPPDSPPRRAVVRGTCLGLESAESGAAERMLNTGRANVVLEPLDNEVLLRRHGLLIE